MVADNQSNFQSTFEYKLIYVFRINDEAHKGSLKVGDATIHTNKPFTQLVPNCSELNSAARKRIDEYTVTAGIVYQLLYTEIAVYKVNKPGDPSNGLVRAFRDHHVHGVLKRSGIESKYFDPEKRQNEWFVSDLETIKKAIQAVKDNRSALTASEVSHNKSPVVFRPEQTQAISETVNRFKTSTKMLWNAKMRFGKTLTALQVAKEEGFSRTIIITHRPVVKKGWFEDFDKIFYDTPSYAFGSKDKGMPIDQLVLSGKKFVYFASMQDLRGSTEVGGAFEKNKEIFDLHWDFVVVDEAHEGTQTELGKTVLDKIIKENSKEKTYVLSLSGTPFNLLTDFEEQSIYTWDYIKEQEAKANWAANHFGDPNPYEELPKMNIFTYHLEDIFKAYLDLEDKAFNFREFFRVWTGDIDKDGSPVPLNAKIGDFVHEQDIKSFLDLLCKKDSKTQYPFSTEDYRAFFRHTLWIVPGVKEAKALSELLKKHHIFQHFKIVNVAGDGDEEIDTSDALTAVGNAMTKHPEETYTITISCGRLTTGVSIPEWTAVLMLAGTYATAASQYLQTIFRVQTPANIDGKIKENCYVFDFAPDRTLKMVAEAVQLSARAGSNNVAAELALGKFLNYCPVIAIEESGMREFKVSYLLQQLKKAYADRVVKNGFDDTRLYNDELLRLNDVELEDFEQLKKIVGASKPTGKIDDIVITTTGLTDEQHEPVEQPAEEKTKKRKLTEEEKQALEELKRQKKNRLVAISILRSISIRIPLMIYGIDRDIDEDITIEAFNQPGLIDDLSWNEFMPQGVTRDIFGKFAKYYDKDIFIAAGRRIRAIARSADELEPTERVMKIASLFSTFRNPDKETVLTPWRVVNIHLSSTLGGYDFFNEEHAEQADEPRLVDYGALTSRVFGKDSAVLEINSKTGLYPLYVAYSIYRARCQEVPKDELDDQKKRQTWDEVVAKHVFVICKTPMAKMITRRTLIGYRDAKVNTKYFEDLINQLRDERKRHNFIRKVKKGKTYWKTEASDDMKFDAVVGNPPYQEDKNDNGRKPPIYPLFYDTSFELSDIVSLISPARFLFEAGQTRPEWNKKMLSDPHIKVARYYSNSREVFPTIELKGGVAIILRNAKEEYGPIGTFNTHPEIIELLNLVRDHTPKEESIRNIVHSQGLYRFSAKFFEDFPDAKAQMGKGTGNKIVSNTVSKFADVFSETKPDEDSARILARTSDNKRIYRFIKRKYLMSVPSLDTFNVFFPEGNATGEYGERLTLPTIGLPGDCVTDTYLSVGDFSSREEAENVVKYFQTRFFRALLGIKKVTQHCPPQVWEMVPLQDFTKESEIDWNASIAEIDSQLFAKYGLTNELITFITSNVEEMK